MSFLQNLTWRFATKKFDPDKKVPLDDLLKIEKAIRLAPSSYGLQAYHIYHVTNSTIRQQIKTAARQQPQVVEASDLFIFCSYTNTLQRIDEYIAIGQTDKSYQAEQLTKRANYLKNSLQNRTPEEIANWAAKQAYIALGFALAACTELKIDSCPMEGFDKNEIDKILKLPPDLKSVVMLTVGYRLVEPEHKKIRFPETDLFTQI